MYIPFYLIILTGSFSRALPESQASAKHNRLINAVAKRCPQPVCRFNLIFCHNVSVLSLALLNSTNQRVRQMGAGEVATMASLPWGLPKCHPAMLLRHLGNLKIQAQIAICRIWQCCHFRQMVMKRRSTKAHKLPETRK